MPITDDIKKTLSDPTPLYALAGAGDLAYEKLREVPGKVEAFAGDRKGAQELAAARLQDAQARLIGAPAKVAETVTALPSDFKALQELAQGFALQQVGRAVELAVKAKEVYDELAVRGQAVVDKGQQTAAGADGTDEASKPTAVVVDVEVVEPVESGAADEPVETVEAELLDEPTAQPTAQPTAEAPAKKAPRARKSTGAK
ncbi:hypothetical protein P3T36_003275 [Kitasatospora sp. MAP12-15]|uniref:hypothetical protein n=1 Tax=unclassified Kitasatospora TaxID=2633591 RepID=UPI0024771CCA|nr:hypothetical protein [Kitasatospora sp. MAP12-44]MDH6111251.1 hypothetical protein [Kitasatospora sp. MAP12-44]